MVVPLIAMAASAAGGMGLRAAFTAAARVGTGLVVTALKHPIQAAAVGAVASGALDAATDGKSTEKVVAPMLRGAGEIAGEIGHGAVNVGREVLTPEGAATPDGQDGSGIGNNPLSGMFNQFAGKMENNAAWALAPALGVAALANGRGNLLQNGMQGAVIMAVVAFMVQIAENMGFKLPGIGNVFNAASGATQQSPAATTELEAANRTGVNLVNAGPANEKSNLNQAFNTSATGATPAPVVQPNPAPARLYAQPVPVL